MLLATALLQITVFRLELNIQMSDHAKDAIVAMEQLHPGEIQVLQQAERLTFELVDWRRGMFFLKRNITGVFFSPSTLELVVVFQCPRVDPHPLIQAPWRIWPTKVQKCDS